MTRLYPWLTALTLLLTTGLVHGLWSERWQTSHALEEAVSRLDLVPLQIGDWQGADVEVDAAAFAQAGARGYWARTYTHRHGRSVLVILMCGRSGRMAVHTPEVCYRGAGYDMLDTPARTVLRDELGDERGIFWNARFAKQATVATQLRLSWAWGDGGDWQAPANPRWEFRGRPFLYKLYASHEMYSPSDADTTAEFLRVLLPELKKILG